MLTTIQPRRETLEGRSWEPMLALGMTSLLTGLPLREDLVGSGAIGQDALILAAGGLPEKIWASKEAGYKVFLLSHDALQGEKMLDDLRVVPIRNIQEAWVVGIKPD
ncbi:MAG: hypothetical protein MN733_14425 [Nitrososphaera sp.]|nr:hypothetical protein [Nitrososphaera sp.]